MTFYVVVAVLLWLAALSEAWRFARAAAVLPTIGFLLWLLAGLRFETGFDWLVYEGMVEDIPPLARVLRWGHMGDPSFFVEPLFSLLVSLAKSLGGGLQVLFAIVAAFNMLVLYRFLRRFAILPLVVLAAYFCWIYLPLQMGTLRQSIAVSFVLLALGDIEDRKVWRAVLFVVVGAGFQFSSLVYVPLCFVLAKRTPTRVVVPVLAALSLVYALRSSTVSLIFGALSLVSPGALGEKVALYELVVPPERSAASIAYVAVNVLVGGFGLALAAQRIAPSRINNVFLNLSYLFCSLQLATAEFPLLWTRMSYVAFIGQATLLTNVLAESSLGVLARAGVWLGSAAASVTVLVYQLSNPLVGPVFIPYQSYALYLVTGDRGSGRTRTEAMYEDFASTVQRSLAQ